jgi:F-type H+-transporting ATPase subunit gamma
MVMMGTRTIRRRMKSVKNTKKITKAMELVAASKMRKSVSAVLSSRPYARLAWDTVTSIGRVTDTSLHPLLRRHPESRRVLLVLLTSDRGLAGGFNTNMVKKTMQTLQGDMGADGTRDRMVEVITIGKRGADAMRRAKQNVIATFTDISNRPRFEDVLPIGRLIVSEFSKQTYHRVLLAYTDFISAISQKPVVLELLPLTGSEASREIGEIRGHDGAVLDVKTAKEYTFEPSPREVLDRLLPRLVETMLYQAVLESAASEHSARMMAMRSATDAAGEMIDDLTFTYNQVRQAGITKEIAEISSGKAALE